MKSLVMNKYSKARGMLRDCGSQEGNLVEFTIAQWQAIDTAIIETEAANADLLEALEDCMALLHTVTMEQPDAKWVNENGWKSTELLYRQAGEAIRKAKS